MSSTAYFRPTSVAEAARLPPPHPPPPNHSPRPRGGVAEGARPPAGNPDARIIAGGQSVLPAVKLGLLAPEAFIDLGAISELRGIRVAGKSITVGAMTTHAAVAASQEARSAIAALAALAAGIGDAQVRNCGTI